MEDTKNNRFPLLEQFRKSRHSIKQEENPASPGSQVLQINRTENSAEENTQDETVKGRRSMKPDPVMSYREYQQSINGPLGITTPSSKTSHAEM
jgi:hypothetical protein